MGIYTSTPISVKIYLKITKLFQ